MANTNEKKGVRINKTAIILIVSMAMVIGWAPLALTIHRLSLLIAVFVGAFIVTFLSVVSKKTTATETPGFQEYLISGLGAIFLPSFLGLLSLALYGIIYGLSELFELLVKTFKWDIVVTSDLVAYYPTLVILTLLSLGIVYTITGSVIEQLYSKTAGMKSAVYNFIAQRGSKLFNRITIIIFILLAWIGISAFLFYGLFSWWSNLIIYLILFTATPSFYIISESKTKWIENQNLDAIQAIQKVFMAAGFEVNLSPRTGQADVDPLLVNLDLYSRKGKQAYAVEIKVTSELPELEELSNMANMTKAAAWVLEDYFKQDPVSQAKVDPLLVLIGVKKVAALKKWIRANNTRTIVIPDTEEIVDILDTDNAARLKRMAALYLDQIAPQKKPGRSKASPPASKKGKAP